MSSLVITVTLNKLGVFCENSILKLSKACGYTQTYLYSDYGARFVTWLSHFWERYLCHHFHSASFCLFVLMKFIAPVFCFEETPSSPCLICESRQWIILSLCTMKWYLKSRYTKNCRPCAAVLHNCYASFILAQQTGQSHYSGMNGLSSPSAGGWSAALLLSLTVALNSVSTRSDVTQPSPSVQQECPPINPIGSGLELLKMSRGLESALCPQSSPESGMLEGFFGKKEAEKRRRRM